MILLTLLLVFLPAIYAPSSRNIRISAAFNGSTCLPACSNGECDCPSMGAAKAIFASGDAWQLLAETFELHESVIFNGSTSLPSKIYGAAAGNKPLITCIPSGGAFNSLGVFVFDGFAGAIGGTLFENLVIGECPVPCISASNLSSIELRHVKLVGCVRDPISPGAGGLTTMNVDVVKLRNVTANSNVGQSHGGAIDVTGAQNVSIESCTFERNDVLTLNDKSGGGGAFFFEVASLIILNSLFHNNSVVGAGGGLSILDSGRAFITQSTVSFNRGGSVGGMFVRNCVDLQMVGVDVEDNAASGVSPVPPYTGTGGIFVHKMGAITNVRAFLRCVTLRRNVAMNATAVALYGVDDSDLVACDIDASNTCLGAAMMSEKCPLIAIVRSNVLFTSAKLSETSSWPPSYSYVALAHNSTLALRNGTVFCDVDEVVECRAATRVTLNAGSLSVDSAFTPLCNFDREPACAATPENCTCPAPPVLLSPTLSPTPVPMTTTATTTTTTTATTTLAGNLASSSAAAVASSSLLLLIIILVAAVICVAIVALVGWLAYARRRQRHRHRSTPRSVASSAVYGTVSTSSAPTETMQPSRGTRASNRASRRYSKGPKGSRHASMLVATPSNPLSPSTSPYAHVPVTMLSTRGAGGGTSSTNSSSATLATGGGGGNQYGLIEVSSSASREYDQMSNAPLAFSTTDTTTDSSSYGVIPDDAK